MKKMTKLVLARGGVPLLITVALLVDLAAGYSLLNRQLALGLSAHLVAVSLWSAGMVISDRTQHARSTPQSCLAILFAMLLFPGLGMLAWSLATALNLVTRTARPRDRVEDPDLTPQATNTAAPPSPGATQPAFVAALAQARHLPEPVHRRAALEVLCAEPSLASLSHARALLADPDPDIRALAAVAISTIEAQLNKAVRSAIERTKEEPHNARHYAALGRLYAERAGQDQSENIDHHSFLVLARRAFATATAYDQNHATHWIALAEVLARLGDDRAALAAIGAALQRKPGYAKAYLLGMELALRERDFELLTLLAEQADAALPPGARERSLIIAWLNDPQEIRHART